MRPSSPAAADGSPKGDAPGFVRVLDDETLLIPDRLGNNHVDSMSNIVENPNIGLIFSVPSRKYRRGASRPSSRRL